PPSPLFPYTTLFRSLLDLVGDVVRERARMRDVVRPDRGADRDRHEQDEQEREGDGDLVAPQPPAGQAPWPEARRALALGDLLEADRKSTRLNSSHLG